MAILECRDPAISAAVDQYVQSQSGVGRPISTSEAVQVLRTALAKCYLSDRALAELVAASAVWRFRICSNFSSRSNGYRGATVAI